MKIAVFNPVSGQIQRIVDVPVGMASLNTQGNEDWLPAQAEQDTTHYVDPVVMQFVPIPVRPSASHDWDWVTKSWLPNLTVAKATLRSAVERERERRNLLPITYVGALFDADVRGQRNVSAWQTQIAAGVVIPAGFLWRDFYNVDHAADAAFINGLGAAITARGTLLYQAAWLHKANIDSLNSIEAVLQYAINQNWPE